MRGSVRHFWTISSFGDHDFCGIHATGHGISGSLEQGIFLIEVMETLNYARGRRKLREWRQYDREMKTEKNEKGSLTIIYSSFEEKRYDYLHIRVVNERLLACRSVCRRRRWDVDDGGAIV